MAIEFCTPRSIHVTVTVTDLCGKKSTMILLYDVKLILQYGSGCLSTTRLDELVTMCISLF